ncbi:MAG: adenylate/guanylate cyclase domain-containing protein [Geminicoccaceae bacterium]
MTASPIRQPDRRLATILSADVVSRARLIGLDEISTLRQLKEHLALLAEFVARHAGQVAKVEGDGFMAEFPSAANAIECAMAAQQRLAQINDELPSGERLELRIGIHVGDVQTKEGDLPRDGVAVATGVQMQAEPRGICLSATALELVYRLLPHGVVDLGRRSINHLAEPISVYAVAGFGEVATAGPAVPGRERPLPLPDKPSIAVLPFNNMSGDPEQEYFADGLVEEIITSLSRERSIFVIARNSTFTYKGRAVDVRQVARELGVRYVLEGSIRKAGTRVRIVGQLIDAGTGHHVWADRFEGDLADIFELQDKVTESVVGSVEPSIRLQEIRQARAKPTNYVTAYDLYLRALPGFYAMTREGFAEVRRLTNEALSIDPGFNLAKALGAYIRSISVSQCWHEPDDIRVAVRMAREVHASARDDPTCLRFAAQVLAYSAKDYDTALSATERSLQLNPNSAQGYTGGGWVNAHASRPLVAIEYFHRAMRLSPLDPEKGIALSGIGMSYLMLERFEEALSWAEEALREMPGYGSSYRVAIGALVGLGRLEEAKDAAARLMALFPTFSVSLQRQINPWRDHEFAERYLRALQLAGVPES